MDRWRMNMRFRRLRIKRDLRARRRGRRETCENLPTTWRLKHFLPFILLSSNSNSNSNGFKLALFLLFVNYQEEEARMSERKTNCTPLFFFHHSTPPIRSRWCQTYHRSGTKGKSIRQLLAWSKRGTISYYDSPLEIKSIHPKYVHVMERIRNSQL